MRLIDADEFVKDMQYELDHDDSMYIYHTDKELRGARYEFVIDCINERKTVNIKENVGYDLSQTEKDVVMICKGWYNKEKYHCTMEALNAYYHKYYGCEDIKVDEEFAMQLWLKDIVYEAIKRDPRLSYYLLNPISGIIAHSKRFVDEMYNRIEIIVRHIQHGLFDLSEYEDMFQKRKYNEDDNTIGVI